jgi:enamine deaminase RidA (YjgF/YER057c/UK114 family)
MIQRQEITSGAPWEERVGYTRAVRVGNHIAVSGTTAVDREGRIVGRDDAYAQVLYCFEIIAAALEEAGASLGDIVRTRVYLTRIDDWQAAGRAHREVFTNTRPASTMLEVSRLIGDGMLVEVEADAILGGRDKK